MSDAFESRRLFTSWRQDRSSCLSTTAASTSLIDGATWTTMWWTTDQLAAHKRPTSPASFDHSCDFAFVHVHLFVLVYCDSSDCFAWLMFHTFFIHQKLHNHGFPILVSAVYEYQSAITDGNQKILRVVCRVDSWEYAAFFKNFVRPTYRPLRIAQHELKRVCTDHKKLQRRVSHGKSIVGLNFFFQNTRQHVLYPNKW